MTKEQASLFEEDQFKIFKSNFMNHDRLESRNLFLKDILSLPVGKVSLDRLTSDSCFMELTYDETMNLLAYNVTLILNVFFNKKELNLFEHLSHIYQLVIENHKVHNTALEYARISAIHIQKISCFDQNIFNIIKSKLDTNNLFRIYKTNEDKFQGCDIVAEILKLSPPDNMRVSHNWSPATKKQISAWKKSKSLTSFSRIGNAEKITETELLCNDNGIDPHIWFENFGEYTSEYVKDLLNQGQEFSMQRYLYNCYDYVNDDHYNGLSHAMLGLHRLATMDRVFQFKLSRKCDVDFYQVMKNSDDIFKEQPSLTKLVHLSGIPEKPIEHAKVRFIKVLNSKNQTELNGIHYLDLKLETELLVNFFTELQRDYNQRGIKVNSYQLLKEIYQVVLDFTNNRNMALECVVTLIMPIDNPSLSYISKSIGLSDLLKNDKEGIQTLCSLIGIEHTETRP